MQRFYRLMLFIVTLQYCVGEKILAVLPFPSPSHCILIEPLLSEMILKGHEITYITSTAPIGPNSANIRVIQVPDFRSSIAKQNTATRGSTNLLSMHNMSPWDFVVEMSWMCTIVSELTLSLQQVQQLIHSEEKFDLILADQALDESLVAGLSYRFQAPMVFIHTIMTNLWANNLVANPSPSSYIPDMLLPFQSEMTFLQRTYNFIFQTLSEIHYYNIHLPRHDKIMKRNFGNHLPYVGDILKSTSLVLVNHHQCLSHPRPYAPNIIPIGGIHIQAPKPLPKDLQTFMDDSKHGVILFSLGTNVKSSDLTLPIFRSILRAFGRMKENVLWKVDTEHEIEAIPSNIRMIKWLPQSDLLAHPNIKLFISHGGLLSTTEAAYRGVPVVGLPIYGDQHSNINHVVHAGLGKILNINELSEETLYKTVQEILNNQSYAHNAKVRSILMRDNQNSPLETALWWIEYTLRHKGAAHLRSAAQNLAWYQLYLLDVIALISSLGIFITFVLYRALRAVSSSIFVVKHARWQRKNKTVKLQ